jgi:type III pantothenate kinase
VNADVCVVAVDVGNSAVKIAVRREQSIVDHSIRIGSARWEQAAIEWVRDQLGCNQTGWRIASVHRSAAIQLENAICDSYADASIHLVTRHDVPMRVDVDHPDQLGIDRLLNAYAARTRIDTPAVVIDAGSAVTVDWVSEAGHFCGGAILPGLGLQAKALATGTDVLPEIEWTGESAIQLPGKNTADAIRSGILAGTAAGVDGLIERYRNIAGVKAGEVPVVLTGGDGPRISPHLRHLHQIMPNLVCRGLLDLPRSRVDQTSTQKELG